MEKRKFRRPSVALATRDLGIKWTTMKEEGSGGQPDGSVGLRV